MPPPRVLHALATPPAARNSSRLPLSGGMEACGLPRPGGLRPHGILWEALVQRPRARVVSATEGDRQEEENHFSSEDAFLCGRESCLCDLSVSSAEA